ncbi:hypothetical protein BWR18_01960 [Tateyamaria omphalii]|uniref:Calcium-binding protein n=1 Tax=Tateyamaria omphalii TaxID=299262 RepID=A0A1P8MRB3_9RHOB|nr:hypothetical protein BWR18_01960 [Tateyamaria omphalii]
MVDAFAQIFNDDAWASFDPSSDSFTIAGTAAQIMLGEVSGGLGDIETVLELDDARLTFEGGLTDFDLGRFTFFNGSTLWIGEQRSDVFDVLRHAPASTHADNQLIGLDGNDHLLGEYGDDKIDGGEVHDHICGQGGDDMIQGGAGNGFLNGGQGNDVLHGDNGRDNLRGGVAMTA